MQFVEPARIRLSPEVADLRVLGIDDAEALFDPARLPSPEARVIARESGASAVRFPLPCPAASKEDRRPDEPPHIEGWLRLERFQGGDLRRLLRARFTHPRSASLAERTWNLLCYVRAQGVGAPEPLAVGARGRGLFSRASFLLTRELDGYQTLERWLAEDLSPKARRAGATALGQALGKLLKAGLELPRLGARTLHLSIEADPGEEACSGASGLPRKNRMPSVAVSAADGGRIVNSDLEGRARALLSRLHLETRGARASWRMRARVLIGAARAAGLERAARARLWSALRNLPA